MAAACVVMFSDPVLTAQEFAAALAMGVFTDTFLVRPLLMPAMILPAAKRRAVDHRIAQRRLDDV